LTSFHEIHNSFQVTYNYPVIFCDDVFNIGNPALRQLLAPGVGNAARCVLFIEDGVHRANPHVTDDAVGYFRSHAPALTLATEPKILPGGETAKRGWSIFERCATQLNDARIDRHSYAIAVGGGAFLDVVGFAAAAVHRGVRHIRIPTTVLAQNDAGIGVKNGIDFFGKKNFLGSFAPPNAVINDFNLLRTLPPEEWRSGTAEAVKVGLIRDAGFFEWIEQHAAALAAAEPEAMRYQIRRCAELHLQHIMTGGDPFERGSARPLDFGHWAAHKLEQMSDFKIRHGHAVAIGMAIDVRYSTRIGLLAENDMRRILDCLTRLGFPLTLDNWLGANSTDRLLDGLADFQEHLGGKLCLTMLRGIGLGVEIDAVDKQILNECVREVV
jgi:3-dehydroquinate synthase